MKLKPVGNIRWPTGYVAGIRKGDRLLKIDGVATSKLILPEIREQMRRSAVGSTVKIVVEREGARREVKIRLRDLCECAK